MSDDTLLLGEIHFEKSAATLAIGRDLSKEKENEVSGIEFIARVVAILRFAYRGTASNGKQSTRGIFQRKCRLEQLENV